MPTGSIRVNDILWTRSGDPVLVKEIDNNTKKVVLENDFSNVQNIVKKGIKNGLNIEQREAYTQSLSNIKDENKKLEIKNLYHKIKALKESNTDKRVIKYLENELQFRIIRDNYVPDDYENSVINLDI